MFSSRAAETFKSIGYTDCYVQCLANVAHRLRSQGRYAEALEQYRTGLALMDDENSGMTPSVANHSRRFALIRIGQCLGQLGRRAEAITTLGEAMSLLDALQVSDFRHAGALEELATLLAEDRRPDGSRPTYVRAAQGFESIGDTEAHHRCHRQVLIAEFRPPATLHAALRVPPALPRFGWNTSDRHGACPARWET